MRHLKKLILLLFLLIFIIDVLIGQTTSDQLREDEFYKLASEFHARPLKGIKEFISAMGRIVEARGNKLYEFNKFGLSSKKINEQVNSELRKNGVKILTSEEYKKRKREEDLRYPIIFVDVNVIGNGFHIAFRVIDEILLQRPDLVRTSGVTWFNNVYGLLNSSGDSVISMLSLCISKFLIDYFKVNPQEKE